VDGRHLRLSALLLAVLLLAGCCKPDPGDSLEIETYYRECMAVMKRTDRSIQDNPMPVPRERHPVIN
jgi:hypothetical protein